jgi:hypothetical protein
MFTTRAAKGRFAIKCPQFLTYSVPIHLRAFLDPALVRLENPLLHRLQPLAQIAAVRHELPQHLGHDLPCLYLEI